MKTEKSRSRCAKPKAAEDGNHEHMIIRHRVYHSVEVLSNGGFCNG